MDRFSGRLIWTGPTCPPKSTSGFKSNAKASALGVRMTDVAARAFVALNADLAKGRTERTMMAHSLRSRHALLPSDHAELRSDTRASSYAPVKTSLTTSQPTPYSRPISSAHFGLPAIDDRRVWSCVRCRVSTTSDSNRICSSCASHGVQSASEQRLVFGGRSTSVHVTTVPNAVSFTPYLDECLKAAAERAPALVVSNVQPEQTASTPTVGDAAAAAASTVGESRVITSSLPLHAHISALIKNVSTTLKTPQMQAAGIKTNDVDTITAQLLQFAQPLSPFEAGVLSAKFRVQQQAREAEVKAQKEREQAEHHAKLYEQMRSIPPERIAMMPAMQREQIKKFMQLMESQQQQAEPESDHEESESEPESAENADDADEDAQNDEQNDVADSSAEAQPEENASGATSHEQPTNTNVVAAETTEPAAHESAQVAENSESESPSSPVQNDASDAEMD